MAYTIRLGRPGVKSRWDELREKHLNGTISAPEKLLYQKWGKAMYLLSENPRHPCLKTHEIKPLSKRCGCKVWQSHLENKTSRAMRMYWVYGPNENEIVIVGLEPHPEDKKNGAYDRIVLSTL